MKALDRAIKIAGNATQLANKLGVASMTISNWKHRNQGVVPSERVIPIFNLTGVTPHELRPDLYPNPTDGLPPEHQHNVFSEGQLNHENQTRAHP